MSMESVPIPEQPGSPAWWAGHRDRQPRLPMSVERITAAALSIADREGLDALSMRRLAAELGTGTAQLYRYVSGKEEVLVHVLDAVMGEVADAVTLAGDWREQVTAMAQGLRSTLAAHPNVAPLIATRIPIGPNAVAGREALLSVLAGAGLGDELAANAYLAVVHYVVGFVLVEIHERAGPEGSFDVLQYYRSLPPDRYPTIAALAERITTPDVDAKFGFGLSLLLDSLHRKDLP